MDFEVKTQAELEEFGVKLGAGLTGGEVIELVGDVGAGKTTLVKAISRGLGIADDVQSPSFTISRMYEARDGLRLSHYDFYRLHEPGIMGIELAETLHDPQAITIVEWGDIVTGVLPVERLTVYLKPISETGRHVRLEGSGKVAQKLMEVLK